MSYSSYADYLKYKNCKRDTVPCNGNFPSYHKYTRSLACCRAWWTNDAMRKKNAISPCNMCPAPPEIDRSSCDCPCEDPIILYVDNIESIIDLKGLLVASQCVKLAGKGTIHVAETLTIPSMHALCIDQGVSLNFAAGAQLINEGALYNNGCILFNEIEDTAFHNKGYVRNNGNIRFLTTAAA